MKAERSAGFILFNVNVAGLAHICCSIMVATGTFQMGPLEEGESDEMAAQRELAEEIGINDVKLVPNFLHEMNYFFPGQKGFGAQDRHTFLDRSATTEIRLSSEHSGHLWLTFEQALKKLTFSVPARPSKPPKNSSPAAFRRPLPLRIPADMSLEIPGAFHPSPDRDNITPLHSFAFEKESSMGPTNVALVKLLEADRALREAVGRYDDAAKSVRLQEHRLAELHEKLKTTLAQLREQQAKSGNLDLDIKSREEHIDKLRSAQQNTTNNKEYQALLTQINTEKIDKTKAEDENLGVMEQVEKLMAQGASLQTQIDEISKQHESTKQQLSGKLATLQSDIDRLRPQRDAAATAVPAKARDAFERMADKYEGEAMAAIAKPHPRREEYICTSCNIDLVVDLYNRLHTRDELVFCPSCHRILYIPDDLPPTAAVNQKKAAKPRKAKAEDEAVEAPDSAEIS